MLLRHSATILPAHHSKKRQTTIAWSADNSKLAVSSGDCVIQLFDEKCVKKHEFSTKALNAKNYSISGLSFSPDSTKLAIGQTDGFLRVYKIDDEWYGKKYSSGAADI